ncbi:MAG: YbjQ family protein [bacterium]|nr:YbjQ family protein [bacterium]
MYVLGTFVVLLLLGFFAGRANENKHYKSILLREKQLLHIPTINTKKPELYLPEGVNVLESKLVSGCVVVSMDYFKMFLASLRNLVGGQVRSYETMLDRGRREAILRMKANAGSPGLIANLRVETSTIGRDANNKSVGSIEVFAYATAVYYQK